MAKIIDSAGKGSAITAAEHDSNLSTFAGKNQSVVSTTHTIDVDDQGETIEYSNASPIAVTLPAISTVSGSNIHTDDFTVTLKNIGAGLVTVTRGGTDTFEDGSTSYTIAQYGSVTIQTDSTLGKWNIISRGFGTTYNDSLTFAGTLTVSGTANISGTFQIGGVSVTSSAAELNYNDITTLGIVQASKTVTADANAYIKFDTSAAERQIRFDTGTKLTYLYGTTVGDCGLYDSTNARQLFAYDESANTITIAPPITASGGVTGDLIGNVSGTSLYGTNNLVFGAIGSYAMLMHGSVSVQLTENTTFAGSALRYAGGRYSSTTTAFTWDQTQGSTPSGTWRTMGYGALPGTGNYSATLCVRIA